MIRLDSNKFRKELIKIMPGYTWTVHRKGCYSNYLAATGVQSSGFNRLSTLSVVKRQYGGVIIEYDVKSSGYGKNSPWLATYTCGTLARALRGLQNHYENMASKYGNHASALRYARKKHDKRII